MWEKPKDFDLILPMPVAMASTGPANNASSGTTAATATGTAAVAAGSTEEDAQKDKSGQQYLACGNMQYKQLLPLHIPFIKNFPSGWHLLISNYGRCLIVIITNYP